MLGHLVGLVKVRVVRGVNLAVRDLRSSDPYVIVRMGKQVGTCTRSFFFFPFSPLCCVILFWSRGLSCSGDV